MTVVSSLMSVTEMMGVVGTSVLKSGCGLAKKTATGPDRHRLQPDFGCRFFEIRDPTVSVWAFWPRTKRPVGNRLQPVFFGNRLEGWRGGLGSAHSDDVAKIR